MATADADVFAGALATLYGVDKGIFTAWVACETHGGDQLAAPYNFLNLGNPSWAFPSRADAVARTYNEIQNGGAWGGLRSALATHDVNEILRAIVESPWAEGHYGAPLISPPAITASTGYPSRGWKASCVYRSWSGSPAGSSAAGGVTDATPFIPTVDQTLSGINQILDIFKAIGAFFAELVKAQTWVRIGEIIGGIILLVLAVRIVNYDIYGGATGNIVRAARKVAML